jgi:hypothetical protein
MEVIMSCDIEPLTEANIPLIVTAFAKAGWEKSLSLFQNYLHERKKDRRLVWVALEDNTVLGCVALKWLVKKLA